MRKIGLRLRSASVYRWLSEVEASHNSFRIAIRALISNTFNRKSVMDLMKNYGKIFLEIILEINLRSKI